MNLSSSMTVKGWIGEFRPKEINVIPLVEDMEHLLLLDRLVKEYLESVKVQQPARFHRRTRRLNYGLIPAALLAKIALSKLHSVEVSTGIEMHPIIGVGSMPFRGHLSPTNVENFLHEYRGLSTVTVQSAFRYDYPMAKVRTAVPLLYSACPTGSRHRGRSDEKLLRTAMYRLISTYQSRIEDLRPLHKQHRGFVPRRRARKLHIGLFGYSRNVKGKAMPRAIPFAAAFYSIGIPPEFIGASALVELSEDEWRALEGTYVNIRKDFRAVGSLVSWQTINLLIEHAFPEVAKIAGLRRRDLRARSPDKPSGSTCPRLRSSLLCEARSQAATRARSTRISPTTS